MEITYLGMNCVRLTAKDIAVICDPYAKKSGLDAIKTSNDVTLLTQVTTELPERSGMVLDSPGEYEVKGAMITGVPARLHIDGEEHGQNATIYSVSLDGIRVGILGNIAPELSDAQIEALGTIDVLIVPVGNHGLTLDATSAAKIISQLEPKYVVPVHYADAKIKYEVEQASLSDFLKEVGATNVEPQPKLRVTNRDLPLETTVAVLNRQGS